MVSMSLMRGQPKTRTECPGIASSPVVTPTPVPSTEAWLTFDVQEIPMEEATRRAPKGAIGETTEAYAKRPTEVPSGMRKKRKVLGWCKSHHNSKKSKGRPSKGKEPTVVTEGGPAPRSKLKSVKDICSAHLGEDEGDYHTI
ncbi:hypothetical protein BHE74_00038685 [Ensete ventricosum]|nr:hypothetical protein BHE74_00038685 [Ensete ventricosum]